MSKPFLGKLDAPLPKKSIIPRKQEKLATLEDRVATSKQAEQLLHDKIHHCKYNAPSMVQSAKEMKKYAQRAQEDGEEVLKYAAMLDELLGDQEEMEMYEESCE